MKRMNLRDWIAFVCVVIILAFVLTPMFANAQNKVYQADLHLMWEHSEHPSNMAGGGYRIYWGPDEGGPWPQSKDIDFATVAPGTPLPSGVTTYEVPQILIPIDNPQALSAVTRYIVMTAWNQGGDESDPSNEVTVPMKFKLAGVNALKIIFKALIEITIP